MKDIKSQRPAITLKIFDFSSVTVFFVNYNYRKEWQLLK